MIDLDDASFDRMLTRILESSAITVASKVEIVHSICKDVRVEAHEEGYNEGVKVGSSFDYIMGDA